VWRRNPSCHSGAASRWEIIDVSFIKRAQEAAELAKAKAEEAAKVAQSKAEEAARAAQARADVVVAAANQKAADPENQQKINKSAREAVSLARRGMNTVVERIDPGTLADLIIKATALQEMTNTALRAKGSPYRIAEIGVEASIPPGISFSIGRVDDPETPEDESIDSTALVDTIATGDEVVLALDGATVDDATATAMVETFAGIDEQPES
jgi:hypothetical protein